MSTALHNPEFVTTLTATPTLNDLRHWWETRQADPDTITAFTDDSPQNFAGLLDHINTQEYLFYLAFQEGIGVGAMWLHDIVRGEEGAPRAGWLGTYVLPQHRGRRTTHEMWTLANAAQLSLYNLSFKEALEQGQKAIELAVRADDPRAEVFARFYTTSVLRRTGDLMELREQSSAMLPLAERLRDRYWLVGAYENQGHVSRMEGRWQTARDSYERGLTVSPREPRLLSRRVLVEYESGEFEQGETYLAGLLEAMRLTEPGPALVYAYTAVVIPLEPVP